MSDNKDFTLGGPVSRRTFLKAGGGAVLVVLAAGSAGSILSACSPAASSTPAAGTGVLDKALSGIGGKGAIDSLNGFSYESSGTRGLILEAFKPEDDPVIRTNFSSLKVNQDIKNNNLRLDHVRHVNFLGVDTDQNFSEILAGNMGFISGVELLRGGPDKTDMFSERVAAIRQQQLLLNPHLILKEASANPSRVKDGGTQTLDGVAHNLVVVQTDVYPITLFVRSDSGTITKLSTKENDMLRRDTALEVFYKNWKTAPGGLLYPGDVSLALGGQTLHQETRKTFQVNPAFDASQFKFTPAGNPVFNQQTSDMGKKTSQYFMMFAAVGLPREPSQTQVSAQELAPGVFHVTGGSHHSMVVEQDNGIFIAEAPLDEARSKAILEWVKGKFPNKSVTRAAAATHHHVDHTGGMRTFAAEGATVMVHASAKNFWSQVLQAPSTILPDALEAKKVNVKIETVPEGGSFKIADSTRSITLYHVASTHAEDVVAIVVDKPGILFISDLFTPGPGVVGGVGGAELNQAILKNGLDIKTIAGGHGGVATIDEFKAALARVYIPGMKLAQNIVCPCQLDFARSV